MRNIMKKSENMISEDLSLRLSVLKFISIVAVVFVHANALDVPLKNGPLDLAQFRAVEFIETLVTYLARFSMPLFLAISGLIYFCKPYNDSYFNFIKKKTKTILWPYLLWNTITIAYMFILELLPFVRKSLENTSIFIPAFGVREWISAYIGFQCEWMPFLYPAWFLLYLYFFFLIIPFLRKYFEKYPVLILVLSIINLIMISYRPFARLLGDCGPLHRTLVFFAFFTIGLAFLKYRTYFEHKATILTSGILFCGCVVFDLCIPQNLLHQKITMMPLSIFLGVIFLFAFSKYLPCLSDRTKKTMLFLSSFTFLIYMGHEFFLKMLKGICFKMIMPNTALLLLLYFGIPLFVMTALVIIGMIMKKYLPWLYKFLMLR